jgi:hypothetical protein
MTRRLALLIIITIPLASGRAHAQERFFDDFETGTLDGWALTGAQAIGIQPSGDPAHGNVLVLDNDGWDVFALLEDSDQWGSVRVEGQVLFPDDDHNYLGLLYNFRRSGTRTDFGNVYIKGNGSYIRVNPHRDGNVSRILYEEYRTPLTGAAAIRVGEWQRFKLEVVGSLCHLYVGDMQTPQVTFPYYEGVAGHVGFQPRSVGFPVWLDNIRVTSIEAPAYTGPALPTVAYQPDSLVTSWEVIGPLTAHDDAIGRGESHTLDQWRPFTADPRGAVLTGRVTQYAGERTVAYFQATVHADAPRDMIFHYSSADALVVWVNGRFRGFPPSTGYAWYDFWYNPDHEGYRLPVQLRAGANHIVVRVQGGQYATGGFFARIEVP